MRIYAPILTIYSIYLVNIAKISIHPEIYTENYSLIVYYYFLSKVGISLIELDKRNILKNIGTDPLQYTLPTWFSNIQQKKKKYKLCDLYC